MLSSHFIKTKTTTQRFFSIIPFFNHKKEEMTKYLLLLGLWFLAFGAQAQDKEHYQLIQNEKKWAKNIINLRGDTEARGFDVIHQDLNIEVDPAVKAIAGSVITTFKATKDNLTELVIDLVDQLIVDSIIYQGNNTTFSHLNAKISIPFPNALSLGTLDEVQIFYHGVPPSGGGFGSFINNTHNGSVPVLWTLSEPYGAYEWWPCKQDLIDKIDSLDFTITVPVGNKVGSNGLLVEESTQNGKSTYHWKHGYPIPTYLVAFATTNYIEYTDTIVSDSGDIMMLNYVYPEDESTAREGTGNLVEVMEVFNDLFGVYPYWNEKYGHAQFGWGGGMEHTTMSFVVSYNHGLLSHELGHQWFGDDVTCGSWEDIWLNEGFATYTEGLTYEHGLGTQTFDNWLVNKINTVVSQPGGSVKVVDTTSTSSIFSWRLSYSKGAMLLHMLRWTIGDDNFYQGIRNYRLDPAIHFGFGRTAQLKSHLEATSGMDLTAFFNSWYSGEGYPLYDVKWSQSSDNIVHISIDQEQSVAANFFKMKIPLQAIGAGIDEEIIVQNDFSGQTYDIQLSGPITELQFDPKHWIVAKSGVTLVKTTDPAISEKLTLAPNPVQDILGLSVENLAIEKIAIFDLSGKLILQSSTSFTGKQDIEVNTLKAGKYVLVAHTKSGKGTVSFVKL